MKNRSSFFTIDAFDYIYDSPLRVQNYKNPSTTQKSKMLHPTKRTFFGISRVIICIRSQKIEKLIYYLLNWRARYNSLISSSMQTQENTNLVHSYIAAPLSWGTAMGRGSIIKCKTHYVYIAFSVFKSHNSNTNIYNSVLSQIL